MSGEEGRDRADDELKRERTEHDKQMQQKFKAFEQSRLQISYVLDTWDRSQLAVNRPVTPDNDPSQNDEEGTLLQ